MIGRQRESEQLGTMLGTLDRGGGAVHVGGAAGIGKTTLVSHACEGLGERGDRMVVSISAHESERALPFAGAAQLLAPLAHHVAALRSELQQALAPCLGMANPLHASPLVEYTAALALIRAAASQVPLVLVVDDSQWLDKQSGNLLGYVGRRLERTRAALIVSGRPALPSRRSWGLPVIELTGLDVPDCRRLAEQQGAQPSDLDLKRLHDWTGGNPRAVIDNVTDEGRCQPGSPDEFRMSPALRAAYSQLLGSFPSATQVAVYVLVADEQAGGAHVRACVERLGLPPECLAPLDSLHLASVGRDSARLLDPLLGHLSEDLTSPRTRAGVHQSLADLCVGHERAWHLAATATLPDDAVAEALAGSAVEARRTEGYPASSRAWQRAAELTTDPSQRADLFLAAATDAFLSGDAARALTCCAGAVHPAPDPRFISRRVRVEAGARASTGDPHGAVDCLLDAAKAIRSDHATTAATLLAEAAVPAAAAGRFRQLRHLTGHSSATDADDPAFCRVALSAYALTLAGRLQAAEPLLSAAVARAADADDLLDPLGQARLCQALLWAGRIEQAAHLATRTVTRAARSRAPVTLALGLVVRSEIRWWAGLWASSRDDAHRARDLAEELHLPGLLGEALVMLARNAAGTGDSAACAVAADRLQSELEPSGAVTLGIHADASRGLLALGYGDLDHSLNGLDPAFEAAQEGGIDHPMVVPAASDLGEALARSGQPRRASLVAAWLETYGEATGLPYASATGLRLRAMLATEPDSAMDRLAHARALLSDPPLPFEIARTLLCEGQILRRAHRVSEARGPLRRAQRVFEGLGARSWVALTQNELSATGLRTEQLREPRPSGVLSPQELQIARAVSRGMSNPEIAGSLFMSRKTVESHLTRIYRKLDLHSRTDLTRVVFQDGLDTGTPPTPR